MKKTVFSELSGEKLYAYGDSKALRGLKKAF